MAFKNHKYDQAKYAIPKKPDGPPYNVVKFL